MRDSFDPALSVAGIPHGNLKIHALDVLSVAFLLIGVHRALTLGVRTLARGLGLALVLLFAVNFSRGVLDFGLQTGANNSRASLYFLAPLVYASTIPHGWDARVWRLIAGTGCVLVAIAFFYFATDGLRSVTQHALRNGIPVDSRPVVAAGALVILESAVLLIALRWPSPRVSVWLVAVAVAGCVALQQRTVWVAGLAVGLIGFARWSNHRIRDAESLVLGATGLLFLIVPLALWGFFQSSVLSTSARETTQANSTLQWRLTGWRELIASHHSLSDSVFGMPAGASWERSINSVSIGVSPHDLYVEQFLRSGLPGVVVLVALGLVLWSRRGEFASRAGLTPTCVGLLLLAQFVFTITYSLDAVQGLIIGIFIASLSPNKQAAPVSLVHANGAVLSARARGVP